METAAAVNGKLFRAMTRPDAVADFVLTGVCTSYLAGFASMYTQVAGLQGPSGIIPLELLPKQSLTLLLRPFCRPDVGMDLICLAGMGSSIVGILVPRGRSAINMAALWWLYTTLKPDDPPMLQDVGFVAIITAASKHLGLAISRWLLFIAMFQSGVGKLLGGCKQWWDLSALAYHYQGQPLPTCLGWTVAQFPGWFHKFSVAAALTIEGVAPLMFLEPFRQLASLRWLGFLSQVSLQMMIGTTGNFGFFNILTATTCFSLLETSQNRSKYLQNHTSQSWSKWIVSMRGAVEVGAGASACALLSALGHGLIRNHFDYGNIKMYSAVTANVGMVLGASEILSKFAMVLARARNITEVLGALAGLFFFGASLPSLTNVLQYLVQQRIPETRDAPHSDSYSNTLQPVGMGLNPGVRSNNADKPTILRNSGPYPGTKADPLMRWAWPDVLQGLTGFFAMQGMLGRGYAMFVRLTGVPTRPEMVIEAAFEKDGPFMEIPFRFKPGKQSARPLFVAPYHPVLDYQLWLATNGCVYDGCPLPPWFFMLLRRLLEGAEDTERLLHYTEYKKMFPDGRPPRFVRVVLYQYRFTQFPAGTPAVAKGEQLATEDTVRMPTSNEQTADWWIRDRIVVHEVMGASELGINKDHQQNLLGEQREDTGTRRRSRWGPRPSHGQKAGQTLSVGLEAQLERWVLWLRSLAQPTFGKASLAHAAVGVALCFRIAMECTRIIQNR